MSDVIREDKLITLDERGAPGRDGVTGDYIRLTQTNTSGFAIQAATVQNGAAYGILTTYGLPITYETTATSMSLEIAGVNAGDPRVLKQANSEVDFDPRVLVAGDFIEVRGRPINPEDLEEGLLYWEVVGPGVGIATAEEVAAEESRRVAVTPADVPDIKANIRADLLRTDWQDDHELVTATMPGRARMLDPTRIVVTVRPRDADYRGAYAGTRCYTDRVQFEMRDLKGIYHSGLTAPCWVLMGARDWYEDEPAEHINYTWDRIVGISTNNKQIFSMFDPIGFYGHYSSTSAAAMMAAMGAGPGHGNFDQLTGTILVYGGIKDGVAIPDGTPIQDTLKPGETINFTTLDFNGTRAMKDPDGTTVVTSIDVRRFGGGYQMMMNSILTFGADAGVAVGYGFNNCFRLANRLQGRNKAGNLITPTCGTPGHVSGQTAITGLADNAVISFPECVRITGWRDGRQGRAFELELPATIQPARRNGVEIPYDNAGIVSDEAAGPKYRQPIWVGSTDVTDESGNAITLFASYAGVRADGA